MSKQKAMIGWPDGGSVRGNFMLSMLALQEYEIKNPSDKYELMREFGRTSGLYIQENRNQLVKCAQFHKADWLLQIDGDESFKPNLLRMLMENADAAEKPIVVGLYSNVGILNDVSAEVIDCIYKETESGEYMTISATEDPTPFQVDAAGTGVMLTHMSVYDKISFPWFWVELYQSPSKKEPQMMNEDIAFCRAARHVGFPIWCDPKCEVTHWKTLPLVPSTMRTFLTKSWKTRDEMAAGK